MNTGYDMIMPILAILLGTAALNDMKNDKKTIGRLYTALLKLTIVKETLHLR